MERTIDYKTGMGRGKRGGSAKARHGLSSKRE